LCTSAERNPKFKNLTKKEYYEKLLPINNND
jgi:hypothetical protein